MADGAAVPLGGADGMNPGVDGGPDVAAGGCVPGCACELANWSASDPVAGCISSNAACGSLFGTRSLLLLTVGLA